MAILDAFPGHLVLVIGDFMLDRYVYGSAERRNPEAPEVPVLRVEERENRVGGAGFVALNILKLGGQVACFGALGNDSPGAWLKDKLEEAGADVGGVLHLDNRPTAVKTRFLRRFGNQREHLLRVDEEDDSDLT
ncbi:MAG TPA: PfkB family carbohydrate kinase, partial [Phycisphaerae bacterium]